MADVSSKAGIGEADCTADRADGAADEVKWFHYVPISCRAQWEALGWRCTDLPGHHGRYSVLGEWQGGGEPVIP